ncbi:hypothetical protein QZH41_012929 [Actinostola sp. cb2023]|nr:hypothetical protein QZH41_012929 [Actinostola sp. cb2023]
MHPQNCVRGGLVWRMCLSSKSIQRRSRSLDKCNN